MVQVRFAVHLAKVGRHEYVFIPKLRSICLLGSEIQRVSYAVMESMYCITYVYSQDYNIASIHALTHKVVSPLKKVKRKADYGKEEDGEEEEDGTSEPPQKAMRRLTIRGEPSQDRSVPSQGRAE